MQQYLARIKPTSKRETQVIDGLTFEKRRSWYGPIDAEMAARLRALPENDLSPETSPKVFDVMEKGAAAQIEQAEQAKAEPTGTTEAPVEPPTPPPPPKAKPSGRGTGRRRGSSS